MKVLRDAPNGCKISQPNKSTLLKLLIKLHTLYVLIYFIAKRLDYNTVITTPLLQHHK